MSNRFGTSRGSNFKRITPPGLARLLVASIFIWASISKWGAPLLGDTLYAKTLGDRTLLHQVLCGGEILMGIWLLCGWRVRVSASIIALLLAFFLGSITYDLFLREPLPCGCGLFPAGLFGGNVRGSLIFGFILDAILLSCAVLLAFSPGPSESPRAARQIEVQ